VSSLDDLRDEPVVARLVEQLAAVSPVEVDEPAARKAAVAILIRLGASGEPEIFFIQRAIYEGDPWSGQIAFPGGRAEESDADLSETAMRETQEETAIDLRGCAELVGVLDDLHPRTVRLPAVVVRPFVFLVGDVPATDLSAEVADCFWVPFSQLLDRSVWRQATVRAGTVEMSRFAFHHGDHVIWGMTERILSGMLALMATPEV
jgi:8-oxo-dGTP pyrophosphatase MutT (NUDIX family)